MAGVRSWFARRSQPAEPPAGVVIGNLDSAERAAVDVDGTLRPHAGTWSLGWLVRSSERWHVPADERSTSQRLVDDAPVVETSVRVPDGYVLHRAWCARQGAADVAVVEIENASKAPVAVALAASGGAPLVLPRSPSRYASSIDEAMADAGTERGPGDVVVFPLAHTARLRVAVPLGGGADVDLAALPSAERVASGWQSHLQPPGALRVELPDATLAARVATARAAVLLAHGGDLPFGAAAPMLLALDRWGHHDRAGDVLASWPARQRLDGSFRVRGEPDATASAVLALGEHWRLARDAELADAAVGAVAKGAHRVARRGGDVEAQLAAADLLDGAGQPEAAERCRRLPARGASVRPRGDGASALLLDVRDVLVGDGADGIDLAPGWPDDWLGQGVEVHDAPTRHGRLSFAVRWHGPRPALLWELVPFAGAVTLRASRLDASWSTTEPRGEALLAPVEPAGGLPGVVKPLAETGKPASSAPEGGTFT